MNFEKLKNLMNQISSVEPKKGVVLMESLIFAIAHLCMAVIYIAAFIIVAQHQG